MRINCWEYADALAMAVRLRKAGKCPEDIDNLYGEIVQSIVNMATALLVQSPKYSPRKRELLDADVQCTMLMHALGALERSVDTQEPRKLVNYTVKCVQNRLRNWVRDNDRRRARLELVPESTLGVEIFEVGPVACNIEGDAYRVQRTYKVVTDDRNL